MTENAVSLEPDLTPALNPGSVLVAARESQSLSQQDVAEQLNLRVDVIRALEAGDYDDLPGETFVRGYLRAYARLLDVDEDDVVEPREYAVPVTAVKRSMHTRSARPRVHRRRSGRKSRFGLVLLALVVLIVGTWSLSDIPGLDVGGWLGGFRDSSESASSSDAVVGSGQFPVQVNVTRLDTSSKEDDEPAARPVVVKADDPESAPAADAGVADPMGAGSAVSAPIELNATPAETEAAPAVEQPPTTVESEAYAAQPIALTAMESQPAANPVSAQTTAPAAAPGKNSLVVMASDASWVDIRDAAGKRLAYGTLRPNEIRQLVGELPFKLVLGDASVLKIQLDGTAVDTSAYIQADRTARFSIDAGGASAN